MGTETIDTTRCRDDARDLAVSGQVYTAHLSTNQPQPLHATLVRPLTAPWRTIVSADKRAVPETCCAWSWYEDESDEVSLGDCARNALAAERVTDLSEVLMDFGIDLDTFRPLASDESARLVKEMVDRHPIAYLYARRVAQLAGVALADDDEARWAWDVARDACERQGSVATPSGAASSGQT